MVSIMYSIHSEIYYLTYQEEEIELFAESDTFCGLLQCLNFLKNNVNEI